MAKYDHIVKYNGIYYATGAEVPETEDKSEQQADSAPEESQQEETPADDAKQKTSKK